MDIGGWLIENCFVTLRLMRFLTVTATSGIHQAIDSHDIVERIQDKIKTVVVDPFNIQAATAVWSHAAGDEMTALW